MSRDAVTGGGCAVSLIGAVGAVVVWWQTSRTQRHLGNEFENNGQDFGAVLTELPLVFLAGAVVPAVVWGLGALLLGRRRRSRAAGVSEFHA
ncbi:hypothetical protein [Streptomyces ardesiacus]|uniref:hypothetical protein n=1 Tax=Streptomyces ardesiacus TaxID=285564 RepID=UPI0033A47215